MHSSGAPFGFLREKSSELSELSDCAVVFDYLAAIHAVLSLSYFRPWADFNSSLVALMVR